MTVSETESSLKMTMYPRKCSLNFCHPVIHSEMQECRFQSITLKILQIGCAHRNVPVHSNRMADHQEYRISAFDNRQRQCNCCLPFVPSNYGASQRGHSAYAQLIWCQQNVVTVVEHVLCSPCRKFNYWGVVLQRNIYCSAGNCITTEGGFVAEENNFFLHSTITKASYSSFVVLSKEM